MRSALILSLAVAVSGCVSAGPPPAVPRPAARPTVSAPPPQVPTQAPPDQNAPSASRFIAPEIMQERGLERVIGSSARDLRRMFGEPQLEVIEGDARKLQFADEPCVLDVYLYPLRPGANPTATHVEARRASDGATVDRASCVRALQLP